MICLQGYTSGHFLAAVCEMRQSCFVGRLWYHGKEQCRNPRVEINARCQHAIFEMSKQERDPWMIAISFKVVEWLPKPEIALPSSTNFPKVRKGATYDNIERCSIVVILHIYNRVAILDTPG